MKKNIKKIVVFALIITLSLTVSCSKNSSETNENDKLRGDINIVTKDKYESQLKYAAEKFKVINPKANIHIKVDNDIENKILSKSNNIQDTVDMVNIEDENVQYFLSKSSESVLDLTEEVNSYKDKISKSKLDNSIIKNKIYAVPWSTAPKLLVYRADIFSKEGVNVDDIKTWSDYIEVGSKIKKDTGKKFLVNVQDSNNNLNMVLPSQLGTLYFNKDGKPDFNSSEWSKVVEIYKILNTKGLNYNAASKSEFINLAKKNLVVSVIADPWLVSELMDGNPEGKGKWSVMKLPAFEDGGNRDISVGGSNFIINKNSSNLNIAKAFAEFMITNEAMQIEMLNKYGSFTTNINAYNLVNFNKKVDYLNSNVWSLFAAVEKKAPKTNYTKYFPYIKDIVRNDLKVVNIKDKDTKVILYFLQKESEDKILEK